MLSLRACKKCNRLNIAVLTDFEKTREWVSEDFKYEKGYVQKSDSYIRSRDDIFPSHKITTRTHVPGKYVSDGHSKHEVYASVYKCERCGYEKIHNDVFKTKVD